MVHNEIVAAAENTATVELEFESTCSNADGDRTFCSHCRDELSVVICLQLSIAIVESNWIDLGCVTGAGGASVRVICLSGDASSLRVIECERLSGAIASSRASTMLRVWRAADNLLRTQFDGVTSGNGKMAFQRLDSRESPAAATTA